MSYQGKRHYEFERSMDKASLDLEQDMQEYVAWKYPPLRVLREAEALERAAELHRQRDIEFREARRRMWDELRELYERSRLTKLKRWMARHQKELERREAERLSARRERWATELRAMAERYPAYGALREIAESGELNFHGGISFRLGALETLKMVSASSIFGEPQYYRDGERAQATMCEALPRETRLQARACTHLLDRFGGMTTARVMEAAIDEALDEDFGATLEWAAELRETYQMRLNPQVILVRAAAHPGRAAWTEAHPGEFGRICRRVMSRGDDVSNQVGYWLSRRGSKRGIPAILKRAWAQSVSDMGRYQMAKYANKGVGLVDVVRICHAKGPLVDELMRDGAVRMPEGQDTWERLRASGMGWEDILHAIRMPHMALLRNLRGIFREVEDPETRAMALRLLKRGVRGGRQLPFRYLSAWKAAEEAREPWTAQVQDALEECMGIACENLPALPGRSAFLADVSGSMEWTSTSSYGSMTLLEIACLASVVGAARAEEEGVVFPFADRMERVRVTGPDRPLETARLVESVGRSCGGGTENPLRLLVEDALERGERWDNIFVYSDEQAGHAGASYDGDLGWGSAPGLVELYRRCVNPRVNVYCVQLGGYANALVPEQAYRMTNLYGWSGKELLYADAVGRMWDEADQAGHGRP